MALTNRHRSSNVLDTYHTKKVRRGRSCVEFMSQTLPGCITCKAYLCVDTASRIPSWFQQGIQIGSSRKRKRRVVHSHEKGIDVAIEVLRKGVFLIQNDFPFTGMVVACQFTTGIDDLFVIAGMMMHIDALFLETINGILGTRFEFKNIVVVLFVRDTVEKLGFARVAR